MKGYWALTLAMASCGYLSAQVQNPTATDHWPQNQQQPQGQNERGVPVYRITVVGRDIPAINYFNHSGWTKIGFRGTSLLPQAKGNAQVSSQNGRAEIKAHFEGLVPPNGFGIEYLTYVLWAITPQGRPVNLGEVLWSKGKADVTVTTNLQSFGLILTAEPYFAVTMPSNLVVMQNYVLPNKTSGVLETVNAHYSLLPRGSYEETSSGGHTVPHPITRHDRSPLELYEAINAVQIADAAGAQQWAPDGLAAAKQDLENAQQMDIHQKNMKEETTYAREAVQSAEDARVMSIRKQRDAAEAAAKQKMEAAREQAQQAALKAQQQREQAQSQAALAAQQQQEAQQRAQQAAEQQREAEQRAQAAQQAAEQAQQRQQQAEQAAAQANQQTEQMREKLKQQLSQVLNTQETARGLIVKMSDVLFGFNQSTLKPDAQIKLAKVSGILQTYPDLRVQVEGYTDNVGSDAYNLKLSQQRAMSVEAFLIKQGVQPQNITAQGYGEADPVASNSTSAGRAQNRRVDMVVSGSSIGLQQQQPTTSNSQPIPTQPQTPGQPQ